MEDDKIVQAYDLRAKLLFTGLTITFEQDFLKLHYGLQYDSYIRVKVKSNSKDELQLYKAIRNELMDILKLAKYPLSHHFMSRTTVDLEFEEFTLEYVITNLDREIKRLTDLSKRS